MTHDGYHAISIAPGYAEVRRAFTEALDNAGVAAGDIAYMNAHGPGTKQCDTTEAAMFDELFPNAEGLFSVKPLAGHCQAAAGSVELLASLYGFERGVIPAPPRGQGPPAPARRSHRLCRGAHREVVSRHGWPQRRPGPRGRLGLTPGYLAPDFRALFSLAPDFPARHLS